MPKGPQGQKRPADAIARAVMVAKIATGEAEESSGTARPNLREMGKLGGQARADRLTKDERTEIAKKAAKTRWKK